MEEKRKRLIEYRRPRTGEVLSFRNKHYHITSDGQVWDDDLKRYLKLHENRGYLTANLFGDDKKYTGIGVHCLVATCYIRLLEQGENVHHRDHNPKNNNLSNLEIIDASEHHRIHWRDGTMDGVATKISDKLKNAWSSGRMNGVKDKLCQIGIEANPPKRVAQLDKDGRLVRLWPSTAETGRNGFHHRHVSECCNGKRKTHKGYRWQYMSDYLAQHDKPVDTQPVQLEFNFQ